MANRNPPSHKIFTSEGVETFSGMETEEMAAGLAQGLRGGEVICLEGPLGSGKTHFVRGLAGGLGIGRECVTSPSFALVHEYSGGRLPLVHMDLYRLRNPGELAGLGLEDYLDGSAVVAIEWGDKFPEALPVSAWRICLESGAGSHKIRGVLAP